MHVNKTNILLWTINMKYEYEYEYEYLRKKNLLSYQSFFPYGKRHAEFSVFTVQCFFFQLEGKSFIKLCKRTKAD